MGARSVRIKSYVELDGVGVGDVEIIERRRVAVRACADEVIISGVEEDLITATRRSRDSLNYMAGFDVNDLLWAGAATQEQLIVRAKGGTIW